MARLVVGMLTVAMAAAACSGDGGDDAGNSAPVGAEADHVLELFPVQDVDDGSDGALFVGVLGISDGCAVLEMEEETAVIHWPFGSGLVDTSGVSRPGMDLVDVAEAREVEMGGGVGDADRGMRLNDPLLTECIERTGAAAVLFASGTVHSS